MTECRKSGLFAVLSSVILIVFLLTGVGIDSAVTTLSNNRIENNRITVIIDAGHGGEDGGTTSCTGVLESHLNLEIAMKLNDLMHLLGISTVMIRESDISVYTEGKNLSEKKISDLKHRVEIINNASKPVLISIHQNHYPDSRYSGAQVFYAASKYSKELASWIQESFKSTLNKGSNRGIKQANGIYLMEKISCPGVLIECGFLSNPEEEAKIRDQTYQKKLCCVIVSAYSQYLYQNCSLA